MSTETERRYGGKSTAERRAERREKLLDTGLELYGTRGYLATSIELLCASAGLNARYFYAEFENREGLLRAIYDRHVEAVFSAVGEAVAAAAANPRARLAAGLGAFVEHSLADPRAARINYFEMVGLGAPLEQRRREVLRLYSDFAAVQLAELAGPGIRVTGGDVRIIAVALVSSADGLIMELLSEMEGSPPPQATLDRIVNSLTELFAAAVGG